MVKKCIACDRQIFNNIIGHFVNFTSNSINI